MRTGALLLTCVLAVSFAGGAEGGAPGRDPRPLARGLQGWLDGTRDLRCRFEQTLVSGTFGSGEPESGTLLLLRPGRMRWNYAKPEAKVALLEGDRTSVYLPEDRQLIRGHLTETGALHTLLAGNGRIEELFVAEGIDGTERGPRLRLVPREATDRFQSVVLELGAKNFEILAAELRDPAGNVIRYRFSGLRRNQGVAPEAFHFEPPPGTEIIESP